MLLGGSAKAKELSINKGIKIARAFKADGARGKGMNHFTRTNRSRDLWRWTKLPVQTYSVCLPILSSDGLKMTDEQFDVVLPSDLLSYMHTLDSSVWQACIGSAEDVAKYWATQKELGCRVPADTSTLPLFFHEDGVPAAGDTSYDFFSYSCLSRRGAVLSRQCVVGIPSHKIAVQTRSHIAAIFSWDLKSLELGVRPGHDHKEEPFLPTSWRGQRAGEALGVKAVLAGWKGDLPARAAAHRLDILKRNFRASCWGGQVLDMFCCTC